MTTRSSAKSKLFVYGTLRDARLLYQLTGKTFPTSGANLTNYEKRNASAGYPYIFPRNGSTVKRLLIWDIDRHSMRRLDRYEDEGRLYFRKKVTVICRGKAVTCETYVGNPKLLYPTS